MGVGIITDDGKILKNELYSLADGAASDAAARGPFWCGVGDGDGTFTDPMNPPAEEATQTGLKNERIRRKFANKQFLVEQVGGSIIIGARVFNVSPTATAILLLEWNFGFTEANFTWKEIGFFAGDVALGQFYDGAAPPVPGGIAGITINYVSPENSTGSGTLAFTSVGTTLTWQAPGSLTAGPAVNIGGGGDFELEDGDDSTKKIRVDVASGSLPGANANATPTIANPGNVALDGLNSASNPTGQIAQNGRLFIVRNINDQVKTGASERPVRLLIEP